jgi:urease accessory protein
VQNSNLAFIQLLDSALPVGAFAHSFGLESLVQTRQIENARDLKEYAETMLLGSWSCADAMAISAVYRFAPQQQWNEVWEVDVALHLSRAARESREAMQKMGKRLLQLARSLHPEIDWVPLLDAIANKSCIGCHATVYGWTTWRLGIPFEYSIEGYLYGCLTSCVNNAVRLMGLGQTQAQIIICELIPCITRALQNAGKREPHDFYTCNPLAEIAAMQHETLYSRLFMS